MTNAHIARSVTGVLWMVSKSDEGQLLQLIKVDLRNAKEGAPAQELDDTLVGHESRHFGEVAFGLGADVIPRRMSPSWTALAKAGKSKQECSR